MTLSRRQFLWSAAASSVLLPELLAAQAAAPSEGSSIFRHGVASGDPLTDRVMLWTRISPWAGASHPMDVDWRIATDEQLTQVVQHGTAQARGERDFTVKVDAGGLKPGRHYFYAFDHAGQRSPVGRTRTLPAGSVDRLSLALVCCSNYPAGYFNVYRAVANRPDLDAVIHVGDYIYEFENGVYGEGSTLLRIPEPRREAVTLSDYRIRYATYRSDADLQAAHAQHPFIVVWDDHELSNDAWAGGAKNHNPELGEGDWATRRAGAYRAYLEWMPIRETTDRDIHLYRSFRFGDMADLVMLDTRGLRDQQVVADDIDGLVDPRRTLLGERQRRWMFDELRSSQRDGRAWRILGQQIMFAAAALPRRPVLLPDAWDGYQAERSRVLDFIAAERIRDVAILSGDIHSSWGFDVPKNPWDGYHKDTGAGSLAVEIVAPAISSAPLFTTDALLKAGEPGLRSSLPHLKFLEGDSNGYVLLDVTRERLNADWYFVPTVSKRTAAETRAAGVVCERGSSHLVRS